MPPLPWGGKPFIIVTSGEVSGGLRHSQTRSWQEIVDFRHFRFFRENTWNPWNSACFCDFCAFSGWGMPPESLEILRNSIGSGAGGAEGPIFMNFHGIMCNFMNYHEIPLKWWNFMKIHIILWILPFKAKRGLPGGPGARGPHRGTGRHGFSYRDSPIGISL